MWKQESALPSPVFSVYLWTVIIGEGFAVVSFAIGLVKEKRKYASYAVLELGEKMFRHLMNFMASSISVTRQLSKNATYF